MFELDSVPIGTHTIQAWHERYGALTSRVEVMAGATADVDFAYANGDNRTDGFR